MTPMQQMGATVSPNAQLTLEEARKALHQLAANHEANGWQMGHLYNTIIDQKLFEQVGSPHAARDFFKEFKKYNLSPATLSHYGAVARVFPEQAAQRYGITTLVRLLTYVKLIEAELPMGDPGAFMVKVPRQDGTLEEKSFAYCTRSEVQAAINHLGAPHPSVPEDDAQKVLKLQSDLQKALGEHTHVAVKARRPHGHETEVDLSHIPLAHLQDVLQSVLDALRSA